MEETVWLIMRRSPEDCNSRMEGSITAEYMLVFALNPLGQVLINLFHCKISVYVFLPQISGLKI